MEWFRLGDVEVACAEDSFCGYYDYVCLVLDLEIYLNCSDVLLGYCMVRGFREIVVLLFKVLCL